MIGWNFPSNNYGTETGLNDAGIETFKGRPLVSLTREIIQNSSDAKIPGSTEPVKVRFSLEYINQDEFPNKENFRDILKRCKDYWGHNEKATSFFKNSLSTMDKPTIPFLKISDFNTIGLTGSEGERRRGSNWFNLILTVGSSDKGSTSGGSFGIGKNAPFACSQLRTVFYGTKDVDGKTAFQGVSKLVTHKNVSGDTTQGTGFYGVIDKNLPITKKEDFSPIFHREEQGTDVFIAGFTDHAGWQDTIIKSVLEDFFVAIHKGNLIVEVENITINTQTLHGLFEKHFVNDTENNSYKYYETMLTNPPIVEEFIDDNGLHMGKIELYIKQKKDFPKKVAMVRSTGMKIFDKGHFRTPLKFAGVFIAKGNLLNQFLRSVENPAHDKWEKDRHDYPGYADKTLKKINSWINSQVKELAAEVEVDEIDVEGMSQFLPDEDEDIPLNDESNQSEGEKSFPQKKIVIERITRKPSQSQVQEGEQSSTTEEGAGGTEDNPGGGRNEETGGLAGGRETGTGEGGNQGGSDGANEGEPYSKPNPARIKHKRIFCVNPNTGLYKVVIEPNKDGQGYLKFQVVGEESKENADISFAQEVGSSNTIQVTRGGKIGPVSFSADKKLVLNIKLEEAMRCALEVNLFEN